MKLFLDTEFNAFGGKLISMALVPEDINFSEFYCEIEMNDQLDPWVRDNVVPHLILVPCSYNTFQSKLAVYLNYIGKSIIVADWPDDIRYFCEALITGPGEMISIGNNINFELNFDVEYNSLVPHNALHDARGIRDFYLRGEL